MNVRRLVFGLYLALFAGLTVTAWLYYVDTRAEYNLIRASEARNRERLEEEERELQEQEKILQRLRTDPAYVEREMRLQFHFVKPDQSVFIFPK